MTAKWGALSAPIYAGDNFRIAVGKSLAVKGRPPARPSNPFSPAGAVPQPTEGLHRSYFGVMK